MKSEAILSHQFNELQATFLEMHDTAVSIITKGRESGVDPLLIVMASEACLKNITHIGTIVATLGYVLDRSTENLNDLDMDWVNDFFRKVLTTYQKAADDLDACKEEPNSLDELFQRFKNPSSN